MQQYREIKEQEKSTTSKEASFKQLSLRESVARTTPYSKRSEKSKVLIKFCY